MDFSILQDFIDDTKKETVLFGITVDGKSYEVTARKFLPIDEKLELAQAIVDASFDENYPNDTKIAVATVGQFLRKYTDIEFGDATDSDIYDAVSALDKTKDDAPCFSSPMKVEVLRNEFEEVAEIVQKIKDAYYKYNTSALAVIDAMKNFDADVDKLSQEMRDITSKENLGTLKTIVDKMS